MLPTFYLSTGAYALFDTGENTDTLTFFYRPAAGETTSSLDWAPVPDNTQFGAPVYSAIFCNASAGCELTDIQNVAVNYTMNTSATPAEGGRVISGGDVEVVVPNMNTGIQISDAAPSVIDVFTRKDESIYPGESYTVGEEIDVIVVFDIPVTITGTPVLYLQLNTGEELGKMVEYADVDKQEPSPRMLRFSYVVEEGDFSNNLTYTSSASLTDNFGRATIRRQASVPTTDGST